MKTKTFEDGLIVALLLCLLISATAGATGYTLTLISQGSGELSPDNTSSLHPSGSTITITATAGAGWYFSNWSGDASGTNNPVKVTMYSDLVVTGNFLAYPTYSLALATNGQGAISLSPPGGSYLSNTVVTATAAGAAGWVFVGWSGATNTGTNPVSLAVDTNLLLTGNFAQLPAFDGQPASVTNRIGGTVTFAGHAVGDAPLSYQWFFSGGPAPAPATNATLILTNVSPAQAGGYWLVATNHYGSATSQIASLTLTNGGGATNVVSAPDEASLRAALAAGGWIGLGFNGTLTLANTIAITNHVILDAGNVTAVISGGNAVRLFYVAPGASLTISNLTLANGSRIVSNGAAGTPADAGAIYNDGGSVTLVGCTVTNNTALAEIYGGVARGGAIFNNGGTVLLFTTTLASNVVAGGTEGTGNGQPGGFGFGGAIFNTNGSVSLADCVMTGNVCDSASGYTGDGSPVGGSFGGGIFQASGSLAIGGSVLAMNSAVGGTAMSTYGTTANPAYGGALAAASGTVTIDHSRFLFNAATGGTYGTHGLAGAAAGGAIYSTATLTAQDSSLVGNQVLPGNGTGESGVGGALWSAGAASLNRCAIYSNSVSGGTSVASMFGPATTGGSGLGGGIFNSSLLAATNCTIAVNSVAGGGGGGVFSGYTVVIPGYAGNAIGGGVYNDSGAAFTAMNLTIASNSCSSSFGYQYTNGFAAGSEIANNNGTLRLHNSIVAGSGTNAYGAIIDDGYNICSDGSAALFSGLSYNNTDPQLAPLGDYGGPTWCLALLAGSPAIDFGDASGAPSTDQRGYIRPWGDGYDMGAYEYGSMAPAGPWLNVAAAAGNLQLGFTASMPGTYRLQASTDLIHWLDVSTNGPLAAGAKIQQPIGAQGFDHRYFRLLVQ